MMNCAEAERLISAERDGALDSGQRATLDQHLGDCAVCRQTRATLAGAAESYRQTTARVEVPSVEVEWREIQRRMRGGASDGEHARHYGGPLAWIAVPLASAAALALAFTLGSNWSAGPNVVPPVLADSAELARVEYVEVPDANASTMVYLDRESGWLVVWSESEPAEGI